MSGDRGSWNDTNDMPSLLKELEKICQNYAKEHIGEVLESSTENVVMNANVVGLCVATLREKGPEGAPWEAMAKCGILRMVFEMGYARLLELAIEKLKQDIGKAK